MPFLVASRRSKVRRVAIFLLVAVLVVFLIPPAQVALAAVWNPPFIPMRAQRWIQASVKGKSLQEARVDWIPLNEIPESLIHYIWASEDQAFFDHQGFDIPRIREAIDGAKDGEARGVSTISMQCARSVFLWQGRSYLRKALEAYYTVWMELFMSKQRILELYLNHIEFGPGIYGIGAAADHYFDKDPDQLTRSQMIALAAILPNPLKWSPVHPNQTVLRKIRRIEHLSSNAPLPREELKRK
jgi:monofunctional biosynthetic peptidoglycan transglycosylase